MVGVFPVTKPVGGRFQDNFCRSSVIRCKEKRGLWNVKKDVLWGGPSDNFTWSATGSGEGAHGDKRGLNLPFAVPHMGLLSTKEVSTRVLLFSFAAPSGRHADKFAVPIKLFLKGRGEAKNAFPEKEHLPLRHPRFSVD